MGKDQLTKLGSRLTEIGFSERAVTMIVEQVRLLDDDSHDRSGLAEQESTFETVDAHDVPAKDTHTEREFSLMVAVAAVFGVLALLIGWWGQSAQGSGELAVLAGPGIGSIWPSLLLSALLVGWLIAWPVKAVLSHNPSAMSHPPLLTVWAGTGLALATLLVTVAR